MVGSAAVREEPAVRDEILSIAGHALWRDSRDGVEVRFVGRGEDGTRDEIFARIEPHRPPLAALRQVHSARAVEVTGPGFHGEADALQTTCGDLALSVITADCVPVLVAGATQLAAIHAGWRGIAGGVVAAGLGRFDA